MRRGVPLLPLLLAPRAEAAGLVDHPFAADSLQYLDGKWKASTPVEPPGPAACTFVNDTDYDTGSMAGKHFSDDPQACCNMCSADPACAAAVWCPAGVCGNGNDHSCWFKTKDAIAKKVTKAGRVACVVPADRPQPTLLTVDAAVPGDLLTDLQTAGLIGDPLHELNWLNTTLWGDDEWTYETTFTATEEDAAAGGATVLVFDGVKMGATVSLNGKALGTVNNQFLRYTFPLQSSGALRAGSNTVSVVFSQDVKCDGRWMACSGGWDWAPYSTTQQEGIRTFSRGVWKSVYVARVGAAAVSHVVPHVFYKGAYPSAPLDDAGKGDFEVRVRVHLWAPAAGSGELAVAGEWGERGSAKVSYPAGDSNVTVVLPAKASAVKLWWPAGVGAQPLYNVSVDFSSGGSRVSAARRVGFRVVAVVTGNDTDPEYVKGAAGADGTSDLGMLFRVNGAAILSRGANMIPMEEMEGRMRADAHRALVRSAADAGMNTLRVWGGGMFLPDAWYDACDELGVLVYHDMQYAQGGHSPKVTDSQRAELVHQVRRLSHHPSIALWDGCNECKVVNTGSTGIYATFVMTVVAEQDQSRAVWPSCPGDGWSSGVDRLYALPNGKALVTTGTQGKLETHGPYQHANKWPTVNGYPHGGYDSNPHIPLSLTEAASGVAAKNVFASEFGSVVMSSFESMSPTLDAAHWGLHGGMPPDNCSGGGWPSGCKGGNPMAQRNYGCDNLIETMFGAGAAAKLDDVGEAAFKRQLYQCMLSQALDMKQIIEGRRTKNEFGILVWQLNEIWPTGGWGSIEYGTPVPGQVLGGRWKPLHHMYSASVFRDQMVTCGTGGSGHLCLVTNDSPYPFKGRVEVAAVALADGKETFVISATLDMPAGAGVKQWLAANLTGVDPASALLVGVVTAADGTEVSRNVIPLAIPGKLAAPKATVKVSVGAAGADGSYEVSVSSDKPAAWVVLTTLAQGRFSENAFLLTAPTTLRFVPFAPGQGAQLRDTIRAEHLAMYQ